MAKTNRRIHNHERVLLAERDSGYLPMGKMGLECAKCSKMDKASLLGDTNQYMKELQQRVKFLEKEIKNNPSKRSAKVPSDVSLSEGSDYSSNEEDIVPEINVRVFDESALINIYCYKQNGVVGRIPSEMERLHLSVRDMNIMSFSRTCLDISVVTEVRPCIAPVLNVTPSQLFIFPLKKS
uniref:Transcription factor bHLH25-like n=1 Tax=Nicotiana sylvestris TaxID=4096 RepID=A0A1U7X5T5_NICSY|nr:PREDICTED: transcription factor bHLH25-like [Nicotiana sylvestris]